MQSKAQAVSDYLGELSEDRREVVEKLREVILEYLPEGFEEGMTYGMVGYFVPHEIYPEGYHCDPKMPLPFMGLASQSRHIGLYHMGLYSDPALLEWFTTEYAKVCSRKLDMGKSCIRFKDFSDIPYDLIGSLCQKITVDQWIKWYEEVVKGRKK